MNLVLLIILILLIAGTIPAYPYSTGWGFYPSGLFLLLLILLLFFGWR